MKTVGVNVENDLAMLDDPVPPSAATDVCSSR
jgi:hypothetical protein